MKMYRFIYSFGLDEDLLFPNDDDAIKHGRNSCRLLNYPCVYILKKHSGNLYFFVCKLEISR